MTAPTEWRPGSVQVTPRPDFSEPDELVVEVSIDTSTFRAAMEATAGAIRAFGEALSRRDPEVVRALSEIAERARQTAPPRTGELQRSVAGITVAEAGRRLQEWALWAAPTYGATVAPEQVDDSQAHDYDPDRCWKCDAKPGVEELDGACWRCWYKLTGSTKAPA